MDRVNDLRAKAIDAGKDEKYRKKLIARNQTA
jgi:hypothetical protein